MANYSPGRTDTMAAAETYARRRCSTYCYTYMLFGLHTVRLTGGLAYKLFDSQADLQAVQMAVQMDEFVRSRRLVY